jgi:SecD/SecF fusion protein
MQNKGAISFFAIILALACLYQLSFTVVTRNAESNYEELKSTDPEEAEIYIDEFSYNIGIAEFDYKECKDKEIQLGLDLRGGMNVTLEVSLRELVKGLSNYSTDPTFNEALVLASKKMETQEGSYVQLFGQAFNEINPNAKLASPSIFGYALKDKIDGDASNEAVIALIQEEADQAIDRAFEVLRTRIDKFGVTQPNIQRLEGSGRILVELPGVRDKERVRKLLQGTAKLEFWETYENQEVYGYLTQANQVLADMQVGEDDEAIVELGDSTIVAEADSTVAEEFVVEEIDEDSAQNSLLDQFGGGDSSATDELSPENLEELSKNNPLFSVLQPAGSSDQGLFSGPVVGYADIRDTAKVNEYMAMDKVASIFPNDMQFRWTVKAFDDEGKVLQLIAIKVKDRDGVAPLTGDAIADASQQFGQFQSAPEVQMKMNAEGANTWKRLTGANIGKSIAIVLDGNVYSFPTVQAEIGGGISQITGNFSIEEAQDLATVLKAGKLPAPAHIVEEAVVGPTLGAESIAASIWSFAGAFIAVLIFMVIYYGNGGWAANLALLANVFFVFGVLASLGAVLTLPGMAGIVLTIGISIDSNVLIFERIREELARGTGVRLAVKQGYNAAYSAIVDSNVTSLLTAIILAVFGTGPIQGFATTLIIGIFCSLFSAIFITRLVFEARLSKGNKINFSTGVSKGALTNTTIDIIGKRKMAYAFSGLIILAGVGSYVTQGFNLGIDFLGGRSYVVEFEDDVTAEGVATMLVDNFGGQAPSVKTFGADNRMKITTSYRIDDNTTTADDEIEALLITGLSETGNAQVLSSQKVGPTIADDILRKALYSILIALVVIFLYIFLRFKKWQFSVGAVIALFHDVLFVLACFTLLWQIVPFSMEIDQALIAAILTVVGYSINDTVVVFDRIREYQSEFALRNVPLPKLVNDALNSTLSRTVITAVTTFLVLLVLFIFGGETIKGFSFALLIGVVVGTYSSIFIATPAILEFYKEDSREVKKKA